MNLIFYQAYFVLDISVDGYCISYRVFCMFLTYSKFNLFINKILSKANEKN